MYIDIRSRDDYNNGHIEDAININYIELLNKIGYNCVNVEGGYNYYLLKKYKI